MQITELLRKVKPLLSEHQFKLGATFALIGNMKLPITGYASFISMDMMEMGLSITGFPMQRTLQEGNNLLIPYGKRS